MKIKNITTKPLFEQKEYQDLYEAWYQTGRYIVEYKLSDEQITSLFGELEKDMTAGGQNRTMIGKGVDVTKRGAASISNAWNSLKGQIYNSTPMAGFASTYDKAAEKLKQATGGDQGLMRYVQKYRDFGEKHPIMQKALYAALVAAAGTVGAAGGPAGIGAAVGLMQTFDKALQGQDIRSAIWSGTKAGVTAATTASLADYLRGGKEAAAAATPVAPTGQETVIVKSGDTLSQIAKNSGVSVQELMAANPQITNPDVIKAGQELVLPAATGSPVYAGGVGTAADTAAKIQSGQYTPGLKNEGTLESIIHTNALLSTIPLVKLSRDQLIDRDATLVDWTLNESLGLSRRGVKLTEEGVNTIFHNVATIRSFLIENDIATEAWGGDAAFTPTSPATTDFGTVGAAAAARRAAAKPGFLSRAWSGAKQAAGKAASAVGQKISTVGKNLTTKVTADKLASAWKKAGMEPDSANVEKFLQQQGVPAEIVSSVFNRMQIPVSTPAAPAAPGGAAPAEPAGGGGLKGMWSDFKKGWDQGKQTTGAAAPAAPKAAAQPAKTAAPTAAAPAAEPAPAAAPVAPAATATPAKITVGQINKAIPALRRRDLESIKKNVEKTLAAKPTRTKADTSGDNTISFPKAAKELSTSDLIRQRQAAGMTESLSWSKDWDPSKILIDKIKK